MQRDGGVAEWFSPNTARTGVALGFWLYGSGDLKSSHLRKRVPDCQMVCTVSLTITIKPPEVSCSSPVWPETGRAWG